jgi:hypothetical protein
VPELNIFGQTKRGLAGLTDHGDKIGTGIA